MLKHKLAVVLTAMISCLQPCIAHHLLTPFEKSGGRRSATYEEYIQFCGKLGSSIGQGDGPGSDEGTDAGRSLHYFVCPASPHDHKDSGKITVFINNGIHAGEPDGVDASMMLLRDIAEGRWRLPANVQLVIIGMYNVGGALNRNRSTRVNQNGPEEYGFRGNSQNLDLNRDFIKSDAQESRGFHFLFHHFDPEIFVDTHVSDGADYQHTMTLLSTQYDKLGGRLGRYFRERLDPLLYRNMERAGWPMIPYVNAEETPEKGWTAFYDPPRFSSGYAALFNTIAWLLETHMLKPFDQRVKATYALLKKIITLAGKEADTIRALRNTDRSAMLRQHIFPLAWKADTTATQWPFKGYTAAYKTSDVTGQQRLWYDHSRPININVPIRDHFSPAYSVTAPAAYIIPHGWHNVVSRMNASDKYWPYGMPQLQRDTTLEVTAYTIDSFKTGSAPYEGHYKHSAIHATSHRITMRFRKGDYLIPVNTPDRRFLIESLEPESEDSYFAWGFFDAILQRKEGYADYRWEDVAARVLQDHPDIKAALDAARAANSAFAQDAAAQLLFVYTHSCWMEPEYMRYPVYRIE